MKQFKRLNTGYANLSLDIFRSFSTAPNGLAGVVTVWDRTFKHGGAHETCMSSSLPKLVLQVCIAG